MAHMPAASARAVRGSDDQWTSGRRYYVDNLKVILVAAIIAGHAVLGYSAFDWWSYADVRETTLSPVTVAVLFAVAAPAGLFVIPVLFLVAGLLTPPSLQRKGPRRYVRERLVRLGIPFAVVAVLVWPMLEYLLFRWLGGAPGLGEYMAAEGSIDTGVLWFVGVLLIFSLVYAAWMHWRPARDRRPAEPPIRGWHLVVLSVAITAGSVLVRLVVPLETDSKIIDLNVSQWPTCAALFGLGIFASRRGWLAAVPDRLRRQCRAGLLVAIAGAGALAVLGATIGGVNEQTWSGGWHWPALMFAAVESGLAVFGAVWLLALAQRHLDRPVRWIGPTTRRSAYGAFLVQGFVLIALALALRPLPGPAEAKAVIVAVAGVVGSFGLAWTLVRSSPAIARVL